ncbi:MAG: MBL fold metallo-hydrolase [Halobacteria archaeon]|nr:MBL fold metallo-hydrolase [Halobacteria archaeon]
MSVSHGNLSFEWFGYATVRMETSDNQVIYIDPGRYNVLEGMEPKDADIVLVTHDHHYDPDAISRVSKEDTAVVAYEKIDTSELDKEIIKLEYGGELDIRGIGVRAVPAYNLEDGDHVRSNGEPYHRKGDVVGLLLDIEGVSVYFPSDTDFLDEHRNLDVDVFIPPIGGGPTMDRHEAAEFVEALEPELVLPVHYNTFPAIETDPKAFKRDVESKGIEVALL